MQKIVARSLVLFVVVIATLGLASAVFAGGPPTKVLMHHILGNGTCQEKYVLPEQVADNPEWELGPCPPPDNTETPTEVVTEQPTEQPTDDPTEDVTETPPDVTDVPHESPVIGEEQRVIRAWGIDPQGLYNWRLDGEAVWENKTDLKFTWLAGEGKVKDADGNEVTAYYTDLPVDEFPSDPCNVRLLSNGIFVLPVTIQFRGDGIEVYGPHYEFSVVTCTLP